MNRRFRWHKFILQHAILNLHQHMHQESRVTMTISSSDKAKGRVLLPSTIIPSRYDLVITPDLEKFTFEGEVKIALTTSQACNTNEITLHAKELCFISANFVVGEANPVEAQEVCILME